MREYRNQDSGSKPIHHPHCRVSKTTGTPETDTPPVLHGIKTRTQDRNRYSARTAEYRKLPERQKPIHCRGNPKQNTKPSKQESIGSRNRQTNRYPEPVGEYRNQDSGSKPILRRYCRVSNPAGTPETDTLPAGVSVISIRRCGEDTERERKVMKKHLCFSGDPHFRYFFIRKCGGTRQGLYQLKTVDMIRMHQKQTVSKRIVINKKHQNPSPVKTL